MPLITRTYLKTAFIYLLISLLVAAVLALDRFINLPSFIPFLSPVFFHLFMVGWVTQMIFGISYWMFPIITREEPRGSQSLGWATYILLNVGLVLRALGEPLVGISEAPAWPWLLLLSALFQWTAALLFVINSWPRIKEKYRG